MQTVKFVRDTDPQREGGPGYKKGDVATLEPSSARRWMVRGAAELFGKQPKPQNADGNSVDSPADVGGEDGADTGERTEPDGDPAGGEEGAPERSVRSRGDKQHGRRGKRP